MRGHNLRMEKNSERQTATRKSTSRASVESMYVMLTDIYQTQAKKANRAEPSRPSNRQPSISSSVFPTQRFEPTYLSTLPVRDLTRLPGQVSTGPVKIWTLRTEHSHSQRDTTESDMRSSVTKLPQRYILTNAHKERKAIQIGRQRQCAKSRRSMESFEYKY